MTIQERLDEVKEILEEKTKEESDVTENQSDVVNRKDSYLQTEFNLLVIYSGKHYYT